MAQHYYHNGNPYPVELALTSGGSLICAPGKYVKGEESYNFGKAALHGKLTDDGTGVPSAVTANSAILLYAETEVLAGSAPAGDAGGALTGTYPNPTLAADAVLTANILDANVTSGKLGVGAIVASLSDNSIATSKFADASITPVKVNLLAAAPASATAAGTAGQVKFAAGYLYFCLTDNNWVRLQTATW
jgi:hypothetical protein